MASKIGWPALASSWAITVKQLEQSMIVESKVSDGMPSSPTVVPLLTTLSPRELEALKLMASGGSVKSIARDMGIQPCTVDQHIKALHVKLKVHTNVQAAVLAVKAGLV